MRAEWLRKGPSLGELVLERRDERKKKRGRLALIMPSLDNEKLLKRHINELKKQTFQGFDIIVIYGEDDNFIDADGLGILHVREKGKNGAAGSFYIGEKIALEDGYSMIAHADDDCLPKSENLLEKLVNSLENGEDIVIPMASYGDSEAKKGITINHYGAFKSTVLKKTGLVFLPMWYGVEDTELMIRMTQNGFRIGHIDLKAWHPNTVSPAFIGIFAREYHDRRGRIEQLFIRNKYSLAWSFILFHLLAMVGSFSVGRTRLAKVMLSALWNGTGMEFFKTDKFDEKGKDRKYQDSPAASSIDKSRYDIVIDKDSTKKVPQDMFELFGKRILIAGNQEMYMTQSYLPIAVVSKSTHIVFEGRLYKMTDERGISDIILSLAFCAISAPFVLIASALFFIRGFIAKNYAGITSDGYGI